VKPKIPVTPSDLCLAAGIRLMIPHHFGMFDFNTVDPVGLRQQVARLGTGQFQGVLPEVNDYYTLV
jgi:L-ascorbate metabolism protein UlaG (beta-lactamase superfamily)